MPASLIWLCAWPQIYFNVSFSMPLRASSQESNWTHQSRLSWVRFGLWAPACRGHFKPMITSSHGLDWTFKSWLSGGRMNPWDLPLNETLKSFGILAEQQLCSIQVIKCLKPESAANTISLGFLNIIWLVRGDFFHIWLAFYWFDCRLFIVWLSVYHLGN